MSIWNRLHEMAPEKRQSFLESDDVQKLVIDEHEMRASYRESLSDIYGTVVICGYEYDAAQALEDVDPVAFRCGYSDHCAQDIYCEWKGTYYAAQDLEDALDTFEEALEQKEGQG